MPRCCFRSSVIRPRRSGKEKVRHRQKNIEFIGYIIGIPIVIGLLYGSYASLGLFITNVPYRILVLAILFAFLQKGASGSATARTFWIGLPDIYITMCILQALGFWSALGWIAVETAIHAPRIILTKLDD